MKRSRYRFNEASPNAAELAPVPGEAQHLTRKPSIGYPGQAGYRRIGLLLAVVLALLSPAAAAQVTVTVDVAGDALPGGMVTATAVVEITDGSALQSFAWTQTGGVPATISGANMQAATVTLGPLATYKDLLFDILVEPPIGEDDLPPNVPPPEGEFPAGLQDRFEVVGLNPFSLEETALVLLDVEVTTSSGTYHGEGEIHTALPWKPATGLRNVPLGVPVLLQGKDQAAYDWNLTPPGGSAAFVAGAATRNPEFVPDVPGLYELEVMDEAAAAPVTLYVYAGTWRGVIVGQDGDGRPIADPGCTGCHSGPAPDAFTPWAQSGHAEILTNNLNTSSHYSSNCFSCHTVGYGSGGIDDAPDYQAFLDADLLSNPSPDNWTTVLNDFPETAQLANIQCENCHGPQSEGGAHAPSSPMGAPRSGLSSNTCATCHGEPLRHARFQQWQLSGHANYELAIDEGESGNCSRCHTANGFLTWLPVLTGEEPGDPTADITVAWEVDETHPQTCVACHDPHDIGTTSGVDTDATVRISGDTPPLIAGFTANDVGRGAICMTCHNTRRGLRNDSTFGQHVGTAEAARAPHGGAQADVLMGQNAYFVTVGNRGDHSRIGNVEDTCVTCHMEETPPPDVLSYNQGGTNHTFFAADDICGECHGFSDGTIIQGPTEAALMNLQGLIEGALLDLIEDQLDTGNTIDLNGQAEIVDIADVADIEFGEFRGRQAMTVTLLGGTAVGPFRMNDVSVVPAMGDPFDLYDVAPNALPKAGWNYNLVINDSSLGVHNPSFVGDVIEGARQALLSGAEPCVESPTSICLNGGRFQVSVTWQAPGFPLDNAFVSNLRTDESGIFYFVNPNNLEFLLKVLDGCDITNHFWVFFAATTNVEFTVTVTDTQETMTRTYTNPFGQPANAVTDTEAFQTCP